MTTAAATIVSSAAPRLMHFARCIHALGEGPLFYMISEMSSSPAALDVFERYAALNAYADLIREYRADKLPTIWRVK